MSGFVATELIREVKIRPGIYDKDALVPPRRAHRQQLWLEVAESLTPADDWENYTEEEKETRVAEVSNKWKNLRDHFYREIKLIEAGEGNKKRKYIYFNEMEFVRPYIGYKQPPLNKRHSRTLDSLSNTLEFRDADSEIDMNEFIKTKAEKHEAAPTRLHSKRISPLKNTLKIKRAKPFTSTPSATLSQKESIIENFEVLEKTGVAKNPTFKIREGDISFCLSLVPTLRQMSDVRKLSAKIDILKILHKNMAQIECSEPETYIRQDKSKYTSQDLETDELIEECDDGVNIKPDPLNESGNTKAWW